MCCKEFYNFIAIQNAQVQGFLGSINRDTSDWIIGSMQLSVMSIDLVRKYEQNSEISVKIFVS